MYTFDISFALINSQMMPGMGMPGMGNSQYKRSTPYKNYVKRIHCQVCDESVKQLIRNVKILKSKNNKLSEETILNITETICNPYEDDGIWITQFDIIKKPPKLELKRITNQDIGECRRECETISITCDKIMDKIGIDLSELLYNNNKIDTKKIKKKHCKPFCKKGKELSDIKMDTKMGKEKWKIVDEERRSMISMMDKMPNNYNMFDPSMMNMEEMMEMYKNMGGDMPENDGLSDDIKMPIKNKKKSKKEYKQQSLYDKFIGEPIQYIKEWWNDINIFGNKKDL